MIEAVLADHPSSAVLPRLYALSPWLDRLGNWNPQLWRQVKQQINLCSFLATIQVSSHEPDPE